MPSRIPIDQCSPLEILHSRSSKPYFLENHVSSKPDLVLHELFYKVESLLVVRIPDPAGRNLGFLWLSSDKSDAFDELVPVFAQAAADRLAPLLAATLHLNSQGTRAGINLAKRSHK